MQVIDPPRRRNTEHIDEILLGTWPTTLEALTMPILQMDQEGFLNLFCKVVAHQDQRSKLPDIHESPNALNGESGHASAE